MGILIAIIVVVLLAGVLLKLVKLALIVAVGVGIVMIARNKFGGKHLK